MKNKQLLNIVMFGKYTLYILILFSFLLNLSFAKNGFSQNILSVKEALISIDLENASVEKVFKTIEKSSDYTFVYNHSLIDNKAKVTVTSENETIELLLLSISKQANLSFRQINDKISVKQHDTPIQEPEVDITIEALDVSGVIMDQFGEPLPGTTILEKGTSNGTVTDSNGNFSLSVSNGDAILIVSSVGYETLELPIEGRSVIEAKLELDIQELSEVVVTAFGIEKDKKALSYAVQEVEGDDLSAVGNTNVVNSLQGKVAGLIVKRVSGAPGSSSRITIRGARSFQGGNEPLYVIDGLPVSSGSRTIDINPSDIKSVNVLKGPNAAALYGLRASNGVIVIETKKGKDAQDGKPSITLESNYNFDQLSKFPDTQMTYAQGERGQYNPYSSFSWGPRIDTMGTYTNQLGEQEEAAAYDNVRDLFQTGGTMNTNISISNAFERGNYAVGIGFTDQKGILKNSAMERINLKLAGGYNLSDKLKLNSSVNYINNSVDEINVPWWATFSVPPSYNLKGKPTHEPGEPYKQINFRGSHDNFYWALENNYGNVKTSRLFGNVSLDYKPLDWVSVNYRVGMDEYNTRSKFVQEKGASPGRTDPPSGGRIANSMVTSRQINSNLNATITKDFGEDFHADLLIGNEFYDIQSYSMSNNGSDIVIGGFHHISNTAVQTTSEYLSRRRVFGYFANLSMSWKNSLFLTATGRNDVVSNMPSGNRSFFYPSVGLGAVFTELFSIPESVITFGKIRASVAEVGQAGPIYSSANLFNSGTATGGFTFPYQGLNAFTLSNQLNSSDLKPENTRTIELGIDLRFLNDRIGLDYTYYDSKAHGQIYQVPIALSTGFSSELRNAGEMSIKGHELILHLTPVSNSIVRWDLTTNFTSYTNRVISLAEGIEQLELGGFRVTLVAQEGEEYPSLRGTAYARDPETGQIVVDSRATLPNGSANSRYGMPLMSTGLEILGKAQPDFDMGFINQLTLGNFSFSAQIDWRQGGKVSSGYNRLGKLYGVLSETENRDQDFVFGGVKGYYDNNGELVVEGSNDIVIQPGYDFYRVNEDRIAESNVYDATYIRLREVKLTYDFPKKWLEKSFIEGLSFYLMGNNLWFKADVPHFDPEMFNTSSGESYNSYPQTKSFGGGLKVNF